MYEPGDLKVFNPNKEISREIILEVLIRHRDALKQARTGETVGIPMDKIEDNQRKINQVRGLNLIISAQREMITISRPIIFFKSMQKWKKDYKGETKEGIPPFEQEDNDYNHLMDWLNFLKNCEDAIIKAERTKRLDDDFLWVKQTSDGDINELTTNFYEMVDDLESSYEQIYLLMLTNKIVSAGIEEDEEMTYKEKEKEAIRRVVEA
jgi:hypothetical protein